MEFRVLGSLAVSADDGANVSLGGPRPRAVLATLLTQPNRVISADRLIDAVWGESPPASAASALQVHVSALRKVLGAERIETLAPGYRIRLEPDELDADRFERLAADGEAALAHGDPERAAEGLQQALSLWQGDAFADVDLPSVRAEAERLAERRLVALEARLDAELQLGRHAALVGEIEAVVAAEPLRERPRAQLMLALYRSGRQADALDAYRDARRALTDELGIDVGAELRELQRRILEQDPSLDLRRASEPAPPALAAPQLIGRDLELAAVSALLREHRLVTLTGTGGVGKTSLALGAAHELGVFAFADLAPLTDAELVLSNVARALGVDEDPSRPLLDVVAERLGEAPPLLLLDNLEHLPASFGLIAELLVAAPMLRVLATSRVRLGLTTEREYRVQPLAPPRAGGETVVGLRSNDAVQLYVDRARRALPSFELTENNAHAVARICRALDGLPLAIELAAARIRVLGADGTARRLGESLALLTRDAPDLPERQRSLRAAIEWSHGLLTDDERDAFAALAVFAGTATLEAIEALLDGSRDTPALVEGLLEANLVTHEPTPDGDPRFGMLATIRAFAVEQLAAGGREQELRDRHLAYCVGLVSAAFEARRTDASAYLRLVAAEDRDNYRAALTHATGRGLADLLLALTVGLIEFWRTTGAIDEGLRWHEQAVALGARADPRLRGCGLYGLAMFTYVRGDVAAAVVIVQQAIEVLEVHGSPVELARALWLRSACANIEGEAAMARALTERALALAREEGDDVLTGRLLIGLSETHRKLGDLAGARMRATESLAVTERIGDDEFRAWALVHLAGYAIEADDLADARAKLSESLTAGRDLDDLETMAISTLFAAVVAGRTGDVLAAAELVGISHALFAEVGEARWEIEREYWEPLLGELAPSLGDRLDELRAAGAARPRDDAVSFALRSLAV